jgi:hypothetical protein
VGIAKARVDQACVARALARGQGIKPSHLVKEQYRGRYWHYEFEQPLSPSDAKCGSSECLGKLLFTLPIVTSMADSIGAWVGLRSTQTNVEQVHAA